MNIQEATSTLFNLASKYRDEKAIEAVKLVEEKFTSTNTERDEIFECLDRLEYCSPKSEPWIAANAKYIREHIQKLSPVS